MENLLITFLFVSLLGFLITGTMAANIRASKRIVFSLGAFTFLFAASFLSVLFFIFYTSVNNL